MVLLKLFVLCSILAISANADEIKREKRTVDLFLRGVGDVFGYDLIRRAPSLPLRQVESAPRPTYFPPAVEPLPPGSYSRIMLQLQQQRQQQNKPEENNQVANNQPFAIPQGAIVLPIASFVPQNVVQLQNAAPVPSALPVPPPQEPQQIAATTLKPEVQQIGLPWQLVALTPVVGQQDGQQNQAQEAPQNQPSTPATISQPQASLQQSPQGLNISFDSGPTRVDLFGTPMAEAIRRSFNFNINWNRNVEPVTPAALVQQISSTQMPTQQTAALQNQPQQQQAVTPAPQVENFEIPPEAITNNNVDLFQKSNQPSQRQLNANFRHSVKKFWETSPWYESFRSEDGKEQDNAQNYFEEIPNKPKTEEIHEEEQNVVSENSEEETSDEIPSEETTDNVVNTPKRNFRKKYTKVKKSISDNNPEEEEKQVKGYYKRILLSRKPRDISKDFYEPIASYSKDVYTHDPYSSDFSFSPPEETHEDSEMDKIEKFDVEADIPKKSKVRTKESKKGFNIVKITKKTQVIKE